MVIVIQEDPWYSILGGWCSVGNALEDVVLIVAKQQVLIGGIRQSVDLHLSSGSGKSGLFF